MRASWNSKHRRTTGVHARHTHKGEGEKERGRDSEREREREIEIQKERIVRFPVLLLHFEVALA